MVMPTPTPFELTALFTIIIHVSSLRGLGSTSMVLVVSEKESFARKSDNAYALISVLGENLRSNPQSSLDHLNILPD